MTGDIHGRGTDIHRSRLPREDTFVCPFQEQVSKGGRTPCMCDPTHGYIHLYPYIYIHMTTHHTLYILTVMDPYTDILCLPLTFSCQMTFISGSSEVMNCVCPFLIMDYMDCTTISDTEQVSQYGHRDDDK